MESIVVAVDGPAGAGKSTICKLVANKLNLEYIDTGAMYRALTLKVLNKNINVNSVEEIMNILGNTKIDLINRSVFLDGKDVSDEIRTPYVSENVSSIAKISEVRDVLVKMQRDMANEKNVIMDGRDIGSRVLKNATLKIFLTASVEERAERRYKEFKNKGILVSLEEVIRDIEERDRVDSTREVTPLKRAEDAVLVDTTGKSIDDVVEEIIALIKRG
ncbi:(d)CMP kinase [Clostridium cylindrosporum]|uniref:Cytidylate kinase n=1 Tax=Clostridium cylindrosporum DSM 605 TaxID=1121307 RepID=A0A0J8G0R7_CLOCY|nr:(d)CMP kinase [Clostridium cylindrosporum]KMT21386.1 cytidylate kinase Cmk [Clostridium cylindrosporum DSM 605]